MGDMMPAKARVFRIHQRPDGRFEARNEIATDSPLGVDHSLDMAIGSAHREAVVASRDGGCTVVIQVKRKGRWQEVDRVEPPRS